MTCKCTDLETRLAEALAAANKFRAERDELRLRMAEGIRVDAYQYSTARYICFTEDERLEEDLNATLLIDEDVEL
jgi:hypothetical protein